MLSTAERVLGSPLVDLRRAGLTSVELIFMARKIAVAAIEVAYNDLNCSGDYR